MKSFLQYIQEQQERDAKEAERHERMIRGLAYSPAGGEWTSGNWGWQTASMAGRGMHGMESMDAEKAYKTDVGTAFDQDPMTGELYGNPAGFKAVAKRRAAGTGYNIRRYSPEEHRRVLRQNMWDTLRGEPIDPDINSMFVPTSPPPNK